ncbi:MAG: DNA-binding protein [Oscillospiraceae bacterium]|nr:DNA-binding protein [Oscillospiraceae bacterium]MBR4192899.1 DNA-binding protein [Oscillospiraceae bacterium]
MKPDKLTMSLLFDVYGELLTDKQRDCFDLHYNQDLTLAEIAELMGTSRQGVHDAVNRAEAQLLRLEEVTGCLARERRDMAIAARLEAMAASPQALIQRETAEALLEAAAALRQSDK